MKYNLTKKQSECFAAIKAYMIKNDNLSPSISDLCELTGTKSKSTIFRLLDALERRGWIMRSRHMARTITLVDDGLDLSNLHIRAALIAAGWTPPKEEKQHDND